MIRINEIKVPVEKADADLGFLAARALKIPKEKITSLTIAKKSLDSRKKESLFFVYSVDVTVDGDEEKILAKLFGYAYNTVL